MSACLPCRRGAAFGCTSLNLLVHGLMCLFSVQSAGDWRDQLHPGFFSPAAAQQEEPLPSVDQRSTSTPDRQDGARPVSFDGGRVKAWLGVLSSTPQDGVMSISGGVEAGDAEVKVGG